MSHEPKYEIHVGNIGTALRLLVQDEAGVVDISSAVTLEITLWKPDTTTSVKTAVLVTDGTDGLMEYVTQAADLDQAGVWKIQGKVVFAGSTFYTLVNNFRVYANL